MNKQRIEKILQTAKYKLSQIDVWAEIRKNKFNKKIEFYSNLLKNNDEVKQKDEQS